MANPVILDNKAHRDMRVITERGAQFGENVHILPVIAEELSQLVLDYPVFLLKDNETGQFGLHVLLGFEPGENLYLQGNTWNASYIPLHVRRQPFMVGFQTDDKGNADRENAVLTIDMDSKRVQQQAGERIFNADGSNSAYLEEVNSLLAALMNGMQSTNNFIQAIADLELIKPQQLSVSFEQGDKKNFEGLYTVNYEKLQELAGNDLSEFVSRGYLQACYLIHASAGQIRRLINYKGKA